MTLKINRRGVIFCLCILGLVGGLWACFFAFGFKVNVTPSYPVGLWRVFPNKIPKVGDYALVELPKINPLFTLALARGFIFPTPDGAAPLIKKLAGIQGDRVVVKDGVWFNGVHWPNSDILPQDSAGRSLSHAADETIPEGFCWVMSDYNRRSFDSRYFGSIPVSAIKGVARPILVWKSK
jgi:conjugative transfer signal peptidase TraF